MLALVLLSDLAYVTLNHPSAQAGMVRERNHAQLGQKMLMLMRKSWLKHQPNAEWLVSITVVISLPTPFHFEMAINFNVFRSLIKHRVLANVYSRLIIVTM